MSIKYSGLQAIYWSTIGVLMGYTVSFLQALGFSNGEIGLISSTGDILALFCAIIVSAGVDKRRLHLRSAVLAVLLIQMLAATELIFKPARNLSTAFCAMLAYSGCLIVNPLYIKLALNLISCGRKINFAISRGVGSLFFAIAACLLGFASERWSLSLMPKCVLVLLVLQILLFLSLSFCYNSASKQPPTEGRPSSLFELLQQKWFVFFLLGIALIFAANNTVNNYMINVVRRVGGNYANLGQITFVLALTEFPAMLIYSRRGRSRSKRFLMLSLIFFPIKLLAIASATSIPSLFAAILLQSMSFGLYTPAVVDFLDQCIKTEDSAKVQSLAAMMPSLGTIIVTPLSGFLLDSIPIAAVLFILTLFAAVGTAVGLLAIHIRGKN